MSKPNIEAFPLHSRLTVAQALDHAQGMNLKSVMVLGTDQDNEVREVHSHMSRETAVYKLVEEIGRVMEWSDQ